MIVRVHLDAEARVARVAITSLAFMFELVPEPVWNTSIGNWASWAPAATSSAAAAIGCGEVLAQHADAAR